MKIKKLILWCMLTFCRLFLVFTKVDEEKVTFISLESDRLSGDFRLLSIELQKLGKYKLNYVLVKFEKSLKGNILYFFSCIRQFFAINTSKLVILDYNNYVVSNFKIKQVKVLQLWHSTGAIKRFGNEVDGREYKIKNYDYAIVNCEYFVEPYAKSFSIAKEQIKVTGIPKTDRLFKVSKVKKDRRKMHTMFPQIKDKKVVLYAPTFRGKLMRGLQDITIDLQYMKQQLGEEYVILYKMHPLLSDTIISEDEDIICCNNMSIKLLFSVTDYLISDYSAIIIDFTIFDKPILLYTPDLERYRKDVGFYVEYEEDMPGPICFTEKQLIKAIKNETYDMQKVRAFRDKFFKYQDGKSCKRVLKLVEQIMEDNVK